MPIQFFATDTDVQDIVETAQRKVDLPTIVIEQAPFRVMVHNNLEIDNLEWDRLYGIMSAQPTGSWSNIGEFYAQMGGWPSISIERSQNALLELALNLRPETEDQKRVCGAVKRLVTKKTKAGLRVRIEGNPVEGFSRTKRYSLGALQAHNQGKPLLGTARHHRFFPGTSGAA